MATLPPIIVATAEHNGQLIRAEVYGNAKTGSLVIHDQQCRLITWNMGRLPALLAALNSIERQIVDAQTVAESEAM